jgi:integrase
MSEAANGSLPNMTVTNGTVIAAYLAYLQVRLDLGQIGRSFVAKAQVILHNFDRHFGDLRATHGVPNDLLHWLAANPKWRSDHTKHDAIQAVVGAFKWAAEEGLIERNPYRRPKGLVLSLRPRPPMTREHFVKLHWASRKKGDGRTPAAGRVFRQVLTFLRRTGARTCECFGATWDQIDWDAGIITQWEHKTAKKTGVPRILNLDPPLLRLLAHLYNRRRPGQTTCFVNCHGTPWNSNAYGSLFRRYGHKLGLPKGVTAYGARHGWAVAAIKSGESDRAVADAMGTKDVGWYGRQTRFEIAHIKGIHARVNSRPTPRSLTGPGPAPSPVT